MVIKLKLLKLSIIEKLKNIEKFLAILKNAEI